MNVLWVLQRRPAMGGVVANQLDIAAIQDGSGQ
jgi:hypothetical protein